MSELAVDRRAEARMAVAVGTVALAVVYALSGITIAGRLPATGLVLLGVAGLQPAWLAVWMRSGRDAPLRAGALLNASLVALWLLSRLDGSQVGVLDTLCAAEALVLGCLASSLCGGVPRRTAGPLVHLAITLAVASLAALAGGHTHAAGASTWAQAGHTAPHYLCRLL